MLWSNLEKFGRPLASYAEGVSKAGSILFQLTPPNWVKLSHVLSVIADLRRIALASTGGTGSICERTLHVGVGCLALLEPPVTERFRC